MINIFKHDLVYLHNAVLLEDWFNKCLNISVKVISAYNLILPYQVVLVQRKCEANRVANDVWSMLLEYIKIYVTETIKVLYLLSDGCPKQNRNHRFLHSLTNYGRFDEIILYFPQPGHSFLPNDRSFGVIKRNVRKQDSLYIPDEYQATIIGKSSTSSTDHKMKPEGVLHFKE